MLGVSSRQVAAPAECAMETEPHLRVADTRNHKLVLLIFECLLMSSTISSIPAGNLLGGYLAGQ